MLEHLTPSGDLLTFGSIFEAGLGQAQELLINKKCSEQYYLHKMIFTY